MTRSLQATLITAGLLVLSGCGGVAHVTGMAPATGDVISIAVGPCFGFCPAYRAQISPGGSIVFTGERHTEVLGERRREAGTSVYMALAADLAAYRPADGAEQRVECDFAISDTSRYTITWRRPDGGEAVATHLSRCSGGPGQKLDTILQALPARLGIAAWAKQVTRRGVSRG